MEKTVTVDTNALNSNKNIRVIKKDQHSKSKISDNYDKIDAINLKKGTDIRCKTLNENTKKYEKYEGKIIIIKDDYVVLSNHDKNITVYKKNTTFYKQSKIGETLEKVKNTHEFEKDCLKTKIIEKTTIINEQKKLIKSKNLIIDKLQKEIRKLKSKQTKN